MFVIMDEMMYFRKNAKLGGLCDEWDKKWGACHGDKERLMRLVLMQQSAPYFATFCYNGNGLTKEYCKSEFGDYINGRIFKDCDDVDGYAYQMFIAPESDVTIKSDVAQMLWCDNVSVHIDETKCPRLYISNGSTVNLELDGYNSVSVYLFDTSTLVVDDADETCNITVYKYSDSAKVGKGDFCLTNNIKVFNKTLRL